jgi:NADPH2:quinone reductase
MKAVVVEEAGKPPVVKEIPIPKPGNGHVLVKVEASPINPSDLMYMQGSYARQMKYPAVPGFEGSGVVVENGGGLVGWGILNKRVSFANEGGAYAEYVVVEASKCLVIGDDLSFTETATAFVNPLTTLCFHDIVKSGNHRAVIHTAAASQLGRMMVRYFASEIPIICLVRKQDQRDILIKEGAH